MSKVREERNERGEILVRERVTAFAEVRSWSQCPVPLYVALIHKEWRTREGEPKEDRWAITSPEPFASGRALVDFYHRRSRIEEVNRALKQPRRLDRFTSPNHSLVLSHVLFILLTYSLLQYFLKSQEHWEQTNRFLRTLRQEPSLGREAVVVYAKEQFGVFDQEEYTKVLLELPSPARRRMLERIETQQRERREWGTHAESGGEVKEST
jgi:hypothetical protein